MLIVVLIIDYAEHFRQNQYDELFCAEMPGKRPVIGEQVAVSRGRRERKASGKLLVWCLRSYAKTRR